MERFDWQPITELSAPRLLRSLDDRVTYRRGAFIELAESITLADIITLDRAINVFEEIETARRTVGTARPSVSGRGLPPLLTTHARDGASPQSQQRVVGRRANVNRSAPTGWSLCGAPWLQLAEISGKSTDRKNSKTSQNRCRGLQPVACDVPW
jgi:hypothetical protein